MLLVTVSRDAGLRDIATWTTPEGTKVARGHDEVGKMVSAYQGSRLRRRVGNTKIKPFCF